MDRNDESVWSSLWVYTRSFGKNFWYFAVAGAVELAGGVDWALDKASPPLKEGLEVPLWLFLVFVFGGAVWAGFRTWRTERLDRLDADKRVDEARPNDPVPQVLGALIDRGEGLLQLTSDNVVSAGLTSEHDEFGAWEDDVVAFLEARMGESFVQRYKTPAATYTALSNPVKHKLQSRLRRLREIRDECDVEPGGRLLESSE